MTRIQSVLTNFPNYFMSIFKTPKKLINILRMFYGTIKIVERNCTVRVELRYVNNMGTKKAEEMNDVSLGIWM